MANRIICSDGEGVTDEIPGQYSARGVKKAFVVNDLDLVRPGVTMSTASGKAADGHFEGKTVPAGETAANCTETFRRTFGIR